MEVWGVGLDLNLGLGSPEGPGVKVEGAATFVWDACGDSGILLTLQFALQAQLGIDPLIAGGHVHALNAIALGAVPACVKDLGGPAFGFGVGGAILGAVTFDADITSKALLIGRLGIGVELDAEVVGDLHGTYKFLIPLSIGNCPCTLGLGESVLRGIPVVGAGYFLGKAIANLAGLSLSAGPQG